MPKPLNFNPHPKPWHPCCLVTVDCGTVHNKMLVQWPGSVSSLLSVSLFKLCRGTGRNWSGLTFRFAAFLSLPIPATAQAPTLATIGLARGQRRVSRQVRSTKNQNAMAISSTGTQFTPADKLSFDLSAGHKTKLD